MKRAIIYFVFILLSSTAASQTQAIRDSIVDTYFCNVAFTANNITTYYTDTIYPYADPIDTIAFYIDDGMFCCWLAHMVLNNDSFFVATNAVSYGYFISPDSLYYFLNCLSPLGCAYNFYCHKISSYTGIRENIFPENPVDVNPNPANNKLIITSESNLTNSKVQLINILGQTTVVEKIQDINNTIELDITKIKNGIYFLSIIQGEKTKVYKIIIQH